MRCTVTRATTDFFFDDNESRKALQDAFNSSFVPFTRVFRLCRTLLPYGSASNVPIFVVMCVLKIFGKDSERSEILTTMKMPLITYRKKFNFIHHLPAEHYWKIFSFRPYRKVLLQYTRTTHRYILNTLRVWYLVLSHYSIMIWNR